MSFISSPLWRARWSTLSLMDRLLAGRRARSLTALCIFKLLTLITIAQVPIKLDLTCCYFYDILHTMSAEHETPNLPDRNIIIRFAAAIGAVIVAEVTAAKDQLGGVDLNPDVGKLRASAMPVKYMNIPDYPPVQEDSDKQS